MFALQKQNSLGKALRRFHESEDGAMSLETIAILAIAVLVLGAVIKIFGGEDGVVNEVATNVKTVVNGEEPGFLSGIFNWVTGFLGGK